MYVCVLVSCCAQRGSAPRKTLALHWLGSVCVSVRVWRWERGSNEGVKIPYHSKINHLSYGLTFTEGLNRGSLWGGCPASVFSSCRVCTRFPSTREKSSIDISGCFCPRVECGPGSEGNWDFPQGYSCACLHVSHVCTEMYDVAVSCVIEEGNLFSYCRALAGSLDGCSSVGLVSEEDVLIATVHRLIPGPLTHLQGLSIYWKTENIISFSD